MDSNSHKIESNISEAEWQVIRVIWAHEGLSSSQIIQNLSPDFDWKPATIKTLLNRLLKKSYLRVEAEGNKYLYFSNISESTHLANELISVLNNACTKNYGDLLNNLINNIELSKTDIAELIKTLETKALSAPEQIICQCNPGQCNC